MNQAPQTGPARLMNRPSIGNGLWWLARRRMSSKRLAENQSAIQYRITKLPQASLLGPITSNLGLGLVLLFIAWSTTTVREFLPKDAAHTPGLDFVLEPSIKQPLKLNYIRIQAKPHRIQRPRAITLQNENTLNKPAELPKNPLKVNAPASTDRPDQTRLSALLHQFTHAKTAQDDGYLEEAKELFLTIARSGLHPALGQESYNRALEILRKQKNQLAYETLAREALKKWPKLKLEDKH